MRTIIIVLIALAALAAGLWLWHSKAPSPPAPAVSDLQILVIDFPKQINADGNDVKGTIHFQAPTGNIVQADFEVVQADLFSPFSFDPQVHGQPRGSFEFFIATVVPQQITLRVTITDDQGRTSTPREFSFVVIPATNTTMPGNP